MGSREEPETKPSVWQVMEIDLMGPFLCKSDVNKHSSIKIWGAVIEDVYSGAVYCDIVMDYSADAVISMLEIFCAERMANKDFFGSRQPVGKYCRNFGIMVEEDGRIFMKGGQARRV